MSTSEVVTRVAAFTVVVIWCVISFWNSFCMLVLNRF